MLPSRCCKQPRAWTNLLGRFAVESLSQNPYSVKLCRTCQRTLPATSEYFHRDKHSKDGLCFYCKECNKAKRKAYYAQNTEKAIAYSKQYVAEHRDETARYQNQYAKVHKEELKLYKEEYSRLHRKGEIKPIIGKRESNRLYREANRAELAWKSSQYYAQHREERLAYHKKYNQTERGIIAKRVRSHNRRALKKQAKGSHTAAQLYELYQKQEGKCFYCKKELGHSRNSWHGDHYIPLSKGGSNDISNIVIACPTCNHKKNAKLPDEWEAKRVDG